MCVLLWIKHIVSFRLWQVNVMNLNEWRQTVFGSLSKKQANWRADDMLRTNSRIGLKFLQKDGAWNGIECFGEINVKLLFARSLVVWWNMNVNAAVVEPVGQNANWSVSIVCGIWCLTHSYSNARESTWHYICRSCRYRTGLVHNYISDKKRHYEIM